MVPSRHADGIAWLSNACISSSADKSGGTVIYPGDGVQHRPCSTLSACHTERATRDCKERDSGNLSRWLLHNATRLTLRATPPRASEAVRVRRGALLASFGNPGHDLALEGGMLDFFAQAELLAADGAGGFDAVSYTHLTLPTICSV